MSDKWTKQLRELSDDYRKAAPEGLLGDIKHEMARRGLSPVVAKRARLSVIAIRRWVAVACVALLACVAVIGLWPDATDTPRVPSGPTAASAAAGGAEKQEAATADNGFSPALAVVQQLRQTVADKVRRIGLQATALGQPVTTAAATSSATSRPTAGATASEVPTAPSAAPSPSSPLPEYGRHIPTQSHHDSPATLLADAGGNTMNRRGGGTWQLGAYYGNTGSMPKLSTNQADYAAYDAMVFYANNGITPLDDRAMVAGPPAITSEHHRRPMRMGLSVRYRLTPRWSLQSGLIYSYLSSDFTTDRGYSNVVTHQKLHYVGVPLTASYSLWQTRKLNVYASAGGMVEQLVSGRARTQETLADQRQPVTTDKVSDHRPVFSTQGALGIEYQATHRLSIYVEPGVSYYFDNGSDVKSSYTDKPFNLNLNLGLRLNIK